jgi:hypothetical protein
MVIPYTGPPPHRRRHSRQASANNLPTEAGVQHPNASNSALGDAGMGFGEEGKDCDFDSDLMFQMDDLE